MKRTMKEQRDYIRVIMLCLTAFICICMSGMKVNAKVSQDGNYGYAIVTGIDKSETAVLTKYMGSNSVVHVPAYIDGIKVSDVLSGVFKDCDTINAVYVDEGIGVLSQTFINCENLEYVSLPSSIKYIYEAFIGCNNIKDIRIPFDNEYYYVDGNAIMTRGKKLVMLYNDSMMPEDTVGIEAGAFLNCANMQTLVIPKNVEDLSGKQFIGLTNLKTISVDPDNPYYDSRDNCNAIINSENKTLILGTESTVIPDDIESIGTSAFYQRSNLKTIQIPDTVKYIESGAFCKCDNLVNAKLSNSLESIESAAFSDCVNLTNVTFPDTLRTIDSYAFQNCKSITQIQLPDNLTRIGHRAFYKCLNIEKVEFSDNLQTIDAEAFYDCSNIGSIVLPDSLQTIGEGAFAWCEKIKSVEIPQNVKTIEDEAFRGCVSVGRISVASGNTSYDSRNNCNAIINTDTDSLILVCKNTVIPSNIKEIGKYAFCNDIPFTNITLPETLETINEYAFFNYKKLQAIYIPKNVNKIGRNSFGYCDALTRIEVDPDNPIYDSRKNCNAIIETSKNEIVVGCATTIFLPEITSIGASSFEYNNSITELILPDTITRIGSQAFSDCNNLKTISLPKHIEWISYCLLFGCDKLEKIIIPDSVKTIYDQAFSYCKSLKSVTIPDSVISFDDINHTIIGAFSDCSEDLVIYTNPDSYAAKWCLECGLTVKPISERDKDNSDDNTGKNDSDNKDSNNGNPGNAEPVDKQPGNPVSNTNNTTTTNATNTAGVQAKGTEVQLTDNNCVVKVSSESTDKPTVDYMKPMQSVANITIPDSVTIDGIVYNVTKVSSNAFAGNKKLKKIVLGKNVTCIEKNAFKNCIKLKTVKCVSTQLNKIGDNAFANCKKLNKIYLSTNKLTAKSVGKNIFKNTSNKLVIKTSKANRKFYKKIFKKKGNNVQIK